MKNWSQAIVHVLEPRRLLARVGLDVTFGDDGAVAQGGSLLVSEVAGGKIIAVGPDQAVRLNADGSLDTTFIDHGSTPGDAIARNAIIDGDRILIAGDRRVSGDNGISVSLFVRAIDLDNGDVDATFGANGTAIFDAPAPTADSVINGSALDSIAVLSNGQILLGCVDYITVTGAEEPSQYATVIFKLTPAGKVDTSFGQSGQFVPTVAPEIFTTPDVAAAADGKFFAVSGTDQDLRLGRYANDGTIDSTFGNAGSISLLGDGVSIAAVLTASDGSILLDSRSGTDAGVTSTLERFDADGAGGQLSGGFFRGEMNCFNIGADGKIVGENLVQNNDFAPDSDSIFRLNADGSRDTTFGDDGLVALPETISPPQAIAQDSEGRVIAADATNVFRFAPQDPVAITPAGQVRVDGTASADTISASLEGDNVIVSLNGDAKTFSASAVKSLIIDAREGDDSINVSVDVNTTVIAAAGNDTIATAGGNDLILAGEGDDSVSAGAGNDKIIGDKGNDTISGGDGNDRIFGGPSMIDTTDFNGEPENDVLLGNAGRDTIEGGQGANFISGGGGRDRLYGGGGADHIHGGAGGDLIYGQGGADIIFGDGGNDRIFDANDNGAADTIHGGAGNDFFSTKDTTADVLFGDGGRDASEADSIDVLTSIEVAG